MVASEIKRVKREHGPGAVMNGSGSHHTWGNIGYWLSSRARFMNSIGSSQIVPQSGFLGGLVLGGHAPLGQQRAQRRI